MKCVQSSRPIGANFPEPTPGAVHEDVLKKMRLQLDLATEGEVLPLLALRAAVAEKLIAQHGKGPWSYTSTEKGVLLQTRTSQVFVARDDDGLIATLRLVTKKPWAIDLRYFRECRRPIYLLSMAVRPEL